MSDRSWAVGLDQPTFEREFLRRMPNADVIPLGSEWAAESEPVYRHIDAPDPEKYAVDGPVEPTDKRKIGGQFICPGCKMSFKFRIARSGHQNGCEKYKALKTQKEESDE